MNEVITGGNAFKKVNKKEEERFPRFSRDNIDCYSSLADWTQYIYMFENDYW